MNQDIIILPALLAGVISFHIQLPIWYKWSVLTICSGSRRVRMGDLGKLANTRDLRRTSEIDYT